MEIKFAVVVVLFSLGLVPTKAESRSQEFSGRDRFPVYAEKSGFSLIVPAMPSHSIGIYWGRMNQFQVLNLNDGAVSKSLAIGVEGSCSAHALAPDGSELALYMVGRSSKKTIDFCSAIDGSRRNSIQVKGRFIWMQYIGGNRLVAATNDYWTVFDSIQGKTVVEKVRLPRSGLTHGRNDFRISRNGELISCKTSRNGATVWDLNSGKAIGEFKTKPPVNIYATEFSDDGKELYVIGRRSKTYLTVFSVDTQKVLKNLTLPRRGFPGNLDLYQNFMGQMIEVLPDSAGILICGQAMIDSESGDLKWADKAKLTPTRFRKIVGDQQIVLLAGRKHKSFERINFPWLDTEASEPMPMVEDAVEILIKPDRD
ncbi:MAG: hypothetical protein AAGA30_21645 [Planctomycetota bacterium]